MHQTRALPRDPLGQPGRRGTAPLLSISMAEPRGTSPPPCLLVSCRARWLGKGMWFSWLPGEPCFPGALGEGVCGPREPEERPSRASEQEEGAGAEAGRDHPSEGPQELVKAVRGAECLGGVGAEMRLERPAWR